MTTKTIPLETPIPRKDGDLTEITLRKPSPGELRGVKLVNLLQMDVGELITVLPRITQPALLPDEVAKMDPADFTQMGQEVITFLARKSDLAALGVETG